MIGWIVTIPDHLKTEEMYNVAVHINPLSLAYVRDHFKTLEMCNEVMCNKLCMLLFLSDLF